MPANVVKSWSKKYGIPERELESRWERAKKQAEKQGHKKDYDYTMHIFKSMTKKFRKESIEEYPMTKLQEFREFVNTEIEAPEDLDELKQDLRDEIEEMTVSAGIALGKKDSPVPAGQDFKKDKLPGERDNSDHKVKKKEVETTDDTTAKERDGYTGVQAGNAKKKPVGEEDEEAEENEVTEEDIREYVDSLSEEEFDKFVDGLDEEEVTELEQILSEESEKEDEEEESEDVKEEEEVHPDEIDASKPGDVGEYDETDGMRSVDADLDTPQKKKHTAKQVDIVPEEASPLKQIVEDVVSGKKKTEAGAA
jgi:hypothetical protein